MGSDIKFEPLPSERIDLIQEPIPEKKQRGWIGVAFIRLLSLLIVGGTLYYSTEGLVVALVLFILIVPVEKLFPRHRGQKVRRPLYKFCLLYTSPSPRDS